MNPPSPQGFPPTPIYLPDQDLDAFFDSLVWEDWEPGTTPSSGPRSEPQKDPPTPSFLVHVLDPERLSETSTAPTTEPRTDDDPTLQTLLDAWPHLSPTTKSFILRLVQNS